MVVMVTVTVLVVAHIVLPLAQWDDGYTKPGCLRCLFSWGPLVVYGAIYGGVLA